MANKHNVCSSCTKFQKIKSTAKLRHPKLHGEKIFLWWLLKFMGHDYGNFQEDHV
jgi:hypothetical protein